MLHVAADFGSLLSLHKYYYFYGIVILVKDKAACKNVCGPTIKFSTDGHASCDGGKSVKTEKAKEKTDPKLYSSILRISANNAFCFFTDIGRYTDRYSACLADFCNAIKTIDARSVEFHFKRRDFATWIGATFRDSELANEINGISMITPGEELRTLIYQTVEARLTKLKKLQASEESYIERVE